MVRYWIFFLGLILLGGCGTKQTTVILLPQEDGKTGAVLIENQASSILLDKPYTFTSADSVTSGFVIREADPEKIKKTYEALFQAEPPKPVIFVLYFESASTQLTQSSMKLLPQISQSAKDREPSEISIIGHTDTQGDAAYNTRLSLARAREAATILTGYDTGLKNISVQGFGEYDLLVPTADNVPEPRNRRVEIMIR
ncbi:MAG: OmpA family protein [Proteobacteria bacterium]|nr:OmpA family protein [Desulfobacula sp.]MBU3953613.1 OmpA family protein [Pseudomonadota bacterium]MBU4133244.1 OmpA family protein [Pseudomonadota bacterium]